MSVSHETATTAMALWEAITAERCKAPERLPHVGFTRLPLWANWDEAGIQGICAARDAVLHAAGLLETACKSQTVAVQAALDCVPWDWEVLPAVLNCVGASIYSLTEYQAGVALRQIADRVNVGAGGIWKHG